MGGNRKIGDSWDGLCPNGLLFGLLEEILFIVDTSSLMREWHFGSRDVQVFFVQGESLDRARTPN